MYACFLTSPWSLNAKRLEIGKAWLRDRNEQKKDVNKRAFVPGTHLQMSGCILNCVLSRWTGTPQACVCIGVENMFVRMSAS